VGKFLEKQGHRSQEGEVIKMFPYSTRIDEVLNDLEYPEWVKKAGKTYITIAVDDWRGSRNLKVTIDDLCRYYSKDARDIMSGCRTLAGHTSDWRPIDELAKFCLEYFKKVNIETLRRVGARYGMTLKEGA
jgi:hypothetical protein